MAKQQPVVDLTDGRVHPAAGGGVFNDATGGRVHPAAGGRVFNDATGGRVHPGAGGGVFRSPTLSGATLTETVLIETEGSYPSSSSATVRNRARGPIVSPDVISPIGPTVSSLGSVSCFEIFF